MFEQKRNFFQASYILKHKAAPDRAFFVINTVKFLNHFFTQNESEPLLDKTEAIEQTKRPDSKKAVMKLLEELKFYSNYLPKMQFFLQLHCLTYFTMVILFPGLKNMNVIHLKENKLYRTQNVK